MIAKTIAIGTASLLIGVSALQAKTVTHSFYGTISSVEHKDKIGYFDQANVGDEIRFRYAFDDQAIQSPNPNNASFNSPFQFWSISIADQTVARFGSLINENDTATFFNDQAGFVKDGMTYNVLGDSTGSWGLFLSLDDFEGNAMSSADLSNPIDFGAFDAVIGNIVYYDAQDNNAFAIQQSGFPSVAIDFSLGRFETSHPITAPSPVAAGMGIAMLGLLAVRRKRAN
ncbi:hypothetical protein JD969_12050 [Planctomycetota bacterium]|nr:hypothetical protein JD969_12050 [Planctomycetota bacterium]